MSKVDDVRLTEFCEKLKVFRETTLTEPQRALLDAILSIVWNATAQEESLKSGFDGCFKANQAELILSYHPVGPSIAPDEWVAMIPRMIKAGANGIKGPGGIR